MSDVWRETCGVITEVDRETGIITVSDYVAPPTVAFTLPGKPQPWQRAGGKGKKRYKAPETEAYQERLQWAAIAKRPAGWPENARYAVKLTAYTDRRADVDNLAKTVLDGLEGVLWANDNRVDDLHVRRVRDLVDPRIVVEVTVLG